MTDTTQTIKSELDRPEAGAPRDAILIHIYPTGPGMGSRYVLDSTSVVIGRGENCQIQVDNYSVSRRHVSIQPAPAGYTVTDLGSTNGTFVNDEPITARDLKDGDYLRIGNCIYRFLMGNNLEAQYHEEIYRLAIFDALTGIPNKRCMLEYLDRELTRSVRYGRPLSLILFDIDHFKRVNDELGHLAGDDTLRELAGHVRVNIRKDELFARYGGEEFAVVLPETPLGKAAALAERLRLEVETHPFAFDQEHFPVTISLGVACTQGEDAVTIAELIRQADDALYQAKSDGRNCVRVYAPEAGRVAPEEKIPPEA